MFQMAENKPRKNSAAVSLGRRGGKKRAANLTPKERADAAKKAAQARWKGKKKSKDTGAA